MQFITKKENVIAKYTKDFKFQNMTVKCRADVVSDDYKEGKEEIMPQI